VRHTKKHFDPGQTRKNLEQKQRDGPVLPIDRYGVLW
jgi:hypothetical protein